MQGTLMACPVIVRLPKADPLGVGGRGCTVAVLPSLKLGNPFLILYTSVSNAHVWEPSSYSQAGWNRCNLNLFLFWCCTRAGAVYCDLAVLGNMMADPLQAK